MVNNNQYIETNRGLVIVNDDEVKGWCVQISTGKIYYQQFGNNAMYDEPNGRFQFILSSTINFKKIESTIGFRLKGLEQIEL